MKHKLPAFLEGIEAPVDGEVAMRKFAAQAGENAIVVGIDEVGRGPLAGPVVACAAVLKSPDALLTFIITRASYHDSAPLTSPDTRPRMEKSIWSKDM